MINYSLKITIIWLMPPPFSFCPWTLKRSAVYRERNRTYFLPLLLKKFLENIVKYPIDMHFRFGSGANSLNVVTQDDEDVCEDLR